MGEEMNNEKRMQLQKVRCRSLAKKYQFAKADEKELVGIIEDAYRTVENIQKETEKFHNFLMKSIPDMYNQLLSDYTMDIIRNYEEKETGTPSSQEE